MNGSISALYINNTFKSQNPIYFDEIGFEKMGGCVKMKKKKIFVFN